MSLATATIAGLLGAMVGQNTPQPFLTLPPPVSVPHAPPDAHPQSVGLARMVSTIQTGTPWAVYDNGWKAFQLGCYTPPPDASPVLWRVNAKELTVDAVRPIFAEQIKEAGLVSSDDPEELFKTDHRSDLLVAGNIREIAGELCLYAHMQRSGYGVKTTYETENTTGTIVMNIEWQIYSTSQKRCF